jgi:site-specific recombinase XerC
LLGHGKATPVLLFRALVVGRQGRLKRRQIQNLFRRYATEAALPPNHRHVHALRHSVAVHVLDAAKTSTSLETISGIGRSSRP